MNKQIAYNTEAKAALLQGIDKTANAVKCTLGPLGRNVVLQRGIGAPHVTKDGVTVADEMFFEDYVENMGAQMIKEVARKTATQAGDATTSSVVIAQELIKNGLIAVMDGFNPIDIKRGMDKAVQKVVEHIKATSRPIEVGSEELKAVGIISANNDAELGSVIADMVSEVGVNGMVKVEPSGSSETYTKISTGMTYEAGYVDARFINNTARGIVELEDVRILLADRKITSVKDVVHIFEAAAQAGKNVLIISDDLGGEALGSMILNKNNGMVKIAATRFPFGEDKNTLIEDIAVFTGATLVSETTGIKVANVRTEHLGTAQKVVITKTGTTIIGGGGDTGRISDRIDDMKARISMEESGVNVDSVKKRLAAFTGSVATIYVGAPTETEVGEKKDRVDDACFATMAALEEGVVAGGGVCLLNAPDLSEVGDTDGEKRGAMVVSQSLAVVFEQILINAGLDPEDIVTTLKELNAQVYNVKTGQYGTFLEVGVIDPAKAVRCSLENAASMAGMLLLTECVVSDVKPEFPFPFNK